MPKDPALLWYFSDWHGGTMLMSRHHKGCYMDLLSAQFFNGPLTLDDIKTVLGSDFGSAWPALQKKFSTTSEGKFFNERLQAEKEKRSAFAESRRKNRIKSKSHDPSSDIHMLPHMVNENRNENTIEDEIKEKGVQGEKPKIVHIGEPGDYRITVLAKYLHEHNTIIHDLREYFSQRGQLPQIIKAGWTNFTGFMRENPGAYFNDPNHLYYAFRTYSTRKKKTTPGDIATRVAQAAARLNQKTEINTAP